jgi:hypothetical protein
LRIVRMLWASGGKSLRAGSLTRTEERLVTDGWMQERPCHVTIDAGAFVTVVRPEIVVGLPERRPGRQCILQVGLGQTIIVKEALVELTLGQRALKIWVFRRRYNGRVHPGAGYPAGVPRDSGRGTPRAMTGPGWAASERSAYSVGVNAVEAYREP